MMGIAAATLYSSQMRAERDENDASDTTHTLTRAQVAARLGISLSSVRRLEWDKLHPEVDDRGVHRFDPAEVDGIVPQTRVRPGQPAAEASVRAEGRRGRLAARVFLMFARQIGLRQIVVATKQPPEVIRELYRQWSVGLEEGEWERRDAANR